MTWCHRFRDSLPTVIAVAIPLMLLAIVLIALRYWFVTAMPGEPAMQSLFIFITDTAFAVLTGLTVYILAWSWKFAKATKPTASGTEMTIPTQQKPWVIERTAPSATETGAWDCPYFDLDYVARFTHHGSLREYVRDLNNLDH